jgi:hypothetical protein
MFKKLKAPKIAKIKLSKDGETYTYFRVLWYDQSGKRQAKQFNNRPEAALFASEQHTAMLNDGASRKVLSTVLSEPVLRQCESAVEKLGGRYDLDAVVRYFLDHHCDPSIKVMMSDAIALFLSSQEPILSQANLGAYRQTLNSFFKSTGDMFVHEVSHQTIETFLQTLRARDGVNACSGKTWENTRKSLNRFFNWCIEKPQMFIMNNPAELARVADQVPGPDLPGERREGYYGDPQGVRARRQEVPERHAPHLHFLPCAGVRVVRRDRDAERKQ